MAIAQEFQALSPEELVSFPRSTQDYIPKAHSKLPFNFAAIAWDIVDSDQFRHLSGESIKLYVYLARHVDLRLKQKTRSNGEYLLGRTFAKKYETIADDCYGGRKSARSVQRYVTELVEAELIEVEKGWGNVCTFTLMAFHQTQKIQEYETNAVQREFQIQQAALRNNKLRLLRQEKDQVIEVEAPAELAQPLHQIPDRQICPVQTRHPCPLSILIETNLQKLLLLFRKIRMANRPSSPLRLIRIIQIRITNNLNFKPFNSGRINIKNWITPCLPMLSFIRSCGMIIPSVLMLSSLRLVS